MTIFSTPTSSKILTTSAISFSNIFSSLTLKVHSGRGKSILVNFGNVFITPKHSHLKFHTLTNLSFELVAKLKGSFIIVIQVNSSLCARHSCLIIF
jgi:hypothetical protein